MFIKYIIEMIIFLGLFTLFVRFYAIGGAINAVFFYPKKFGNSKILQTLNPADSERILPQADWIFQK